MKLKILDLLFPIECLCCGKAGQYLCNDCLSKIPLNHHFICPFCGHSSFLGNVCFGCRQSASLDGTWLASDYKNEILKDSIKAFKYHYVVNLAVPLSQLLIGFLKNIQNQQPINFDFDLIIPVPLHYRKQLLRGFNQSELLANPISKEFNLPVVATALKRWRFTHSQMKLKEKKRLKNVVGAFKVVDKKKLLVGKKILLVDDVLTTATTLNECAKVLKAAGAKSVWALALAKS